MSDLPPRPDGMSPEFYDACLAVTDRRPRTVIMHILRHGFITTEELKDVYRYNHPPRAIRDVREQGIPLETYRVRAKDNRSIAAYRFAYESALVSGRVGGRKAFSRQFKQRLLEHYGSHSMLTNEQLEASYLQIDHRIPYEIAGNTAGETLDQFMLLDASSQRAKSWACEHCENYRTIKNPSICGECFWAFPEKYNHVAMRQERRLDIIWQGEEAALFDRFKKESDHQHQTPQQFVKSLIAAFLERHE